MKKLTQEDFKGAPDWVVSAAVDADGTAFYHSVRAARLLLWLDVPFPMFKSTSSYVHEIGTGYDTSDWQNSAIDRRDCSMSNVVDIGAIDVSIKDNKVNIFDGSAWVGIQFDVSDWDLVKDTIDKLITDISE